MGYLYNFFFNQKQQGAISLKIPSQIKTFIKQYLIYFQDFVKNVKNVDIKFNVTDNNDTLELIFDEDYNEKLISSYLNEYLNFIALNVDSIQPEFTGGINKETKDFTVLQLKQQVSHLQMQLQFKEFQVKHLEQKVSDLNNDKRAFFELQLEEKRNPSPIQLLTQASASSNQSLNNSNSVNVHTEIKNEIPGLQKTINQLKKELDKLPKNELQELEKLDNELLEIDTEQANKKEFRKPINRLKRILDEINEEGSTLNKAAKAGKKTIDTAQSLAKTYNKFAQWLAMPQVPDVFLGDKK